MSGLKTHRESFSFLLKLFLISCLIESCLSYSCYPPFLPLRISEANILQADICPTLTLSVKYRIDVSSSITCATAASANVIANDINSTPEALCAEIHPLSNPIPSYHPNLSTCPPGKRKTTLSEALEYLTIICQSLGNNDIAQLEDDFVIEGKGNGSDCPIGPSNGMGVTNIVCTDLPDITLQVVLSGEPTCISPCQTCSRITAACTSCVPSFPYLYNGICYDECPIGTYASSGKCFGKVN